MSHSTSTIITSKKSQQCDFIIPVSPYKTQNIFKHMILKCPRKLYGVSIFILLYTSAYIANQVWVRSLWYVNKLFTAVLFAPDAGVDRWLHIRWSFVCHRLRRLQTYTRAILIQNYIFWIFFLFTYRMTSIREHREYSSNVVRDLHSRPLSPYQSKFDSNLGEKMVLFAIP